jgi:hypothetical protein
MGFEKWPEKQGPVVKTGVSSSSILAKSIIKNKDKQAFYLDPADKRQYPKLVQALRFQGYHGFKRDDNGRPYIDIESMTQQEKDKLKVTITNLKEQAKKYRASRAESLPIGNRTG